MDNIINPRAYSYCPRCGSRSLARVYSMLMKYPLVDSEVWDRCNDCKYQAVQGIFENENKISERDKKINNILCQI